MKSSCREGGVDLQIVPRPSWGKKNNTLTGSSSGLGHCSFPVTRPTPARQQSVFYCFIFTLFYVLMRTFWLGWPKGRLSETAAGLAGERLLARLEVEGECTGSRVDWPTAWPGPASPDKQDRQDGVSSCPAPVLICSHELRDYELQTELKHREPRLLITKINTRISLPSISHSY